MKSKLKTNNVSRFNEKSYFNTILGLGPICDYKPNFEKISQYKINKNTTKKIHSSCDRITGSILTRSKQPIVYSFALVKTPG